MVPFVDYVEKPKHTLVLFVQLLSHTRLFLTPWTAACQVSLFFTVSWSFLKLMSIESAMPSNHLILFCLLLLLPSIFPSIRVFSSESALHIRWPEYWSFSFNISPFNAYSGLISFRIYWFDLLAVQGTLKRLLQHHSWKALILWHSAFFMVQLSHPYMTTGLYPLPNLFLSEIDFSDRALKLRNIVEPLWHEIARDEEGWVSKPIISDFPQNLIVSPIENNWNFLTRWLVVPVTKIEHTDFLKGFYKYVFPWVVDLYVPVTVSSTYVLEYSFKCLKFSASVFIGFIDLNAISKKIKYTIHVSLPDTLFFCVCLNDSGLINRFYCILESCTQRMYCCHRQSWEGKVKMSQRVWETMSQFIWELPLYKPAAPHKSPCSF